MTNELTYAHDGLSLHRFLDAGWNILQNPLGGGIYNARGEGGWWVYKGDETIARTEQAQRWATIKQNMDAYYAQPWV